MTAASPGPRASILWWDWPDSIYANDNDKVISIPAMPMHPLGCTVDRDPDRRAVLAFDEIDSLAGGPILP